MTQIAESKRRKSDGIDFHSTDPRWTYALLRNYRILGAVLEPCAGDGAMVDVMRSRGIDVIASDLVDRGIYTVKDAMSYERAPNIVTNPPYSQADEMIEHFLLITEGVVAVLMRIAWLQGKKRKERIFDKKRPDTVIIVNGRMPLPNGQHSQFPHVWVTWDNTHQTDFTQLVWTNP